MKETKLIWTVVVAVVLFSFIGIAYFPFSPAKWAHEHSYDKQEKVTLYVNKVGPFRNPQETYSYYSLPFCPPDKIVESKTEGLGEALLGYELIESRITIRFREDMPRAKICARTLNKQQAKSFKNAIFQHYWYQLFLDDLPIWGMVGEYLDDDTSPQAFIYTHKSFSISWNENRVIEVNLTSEQPKAVEEGMELEFTYSVEWHHTDTPFEDRFRKYLDRSFFEHKIHWFSIFNSFMMVIFLVGLVSIILMRTLRKDYARFGIKDDEDGQDDDISDESGWKQVHGDVFRAPSRLILFSSLVGTGHQLVILVLSVLFLATVGTYYARRGTVVTAAIVCYAFTSFVAGYSSGGYYARNNGKHWIKTMLCTASLFPGLCFLIALGLNFIALSYESLNYIPFGSMVAVLSIWIFIAFPLTLVGTVIGKNWNGDNNAPCRVNQVPRQIPEKKWYLQPWVHVALGGVLPFGSIFIEMYFIFTSFYKYYYVYGFMCLVFVILIIVTVCVTIVSTYFLLNSEDYRWQWTSFLSAASTAGYVYLYAIYYFLVKTKMSGFFQTAFYFGYMAMFCLGLAILCGAIGFIGTSIFVRKIYGMIKID
ncbi:Transmembrane 9 superfamily member 1 [Balamuthia mandrillaris]